MLRLRASISAAVRALHRFVNLLLLGSFLGLAHIARAEGGEPLPAELQNEWDAIMRWAPGNKAEEKTSAADGQAGSPLEAGPGAEEGSESAERSARRQRAKHTRKQHEVRSKPIKKGVSASYQALRAQWHASCPEDEVYISDSTPALVFRVVGEQTPFVVLVPEETGGPFDPEQLEIARAAFRGGPESPEVNERLLGLIHRATRYFDVPYVHLVSGIRRDRGASRHTHGLAADIVLPGVEDEDLAAFFREQGFVGVGVYTRAGFVHVDVRDRSFFWIDPSPPGKTMRIRPVRAEEAKTADEAAVARGEEPFVNPPRLSRALEKRNAVKRKKRQKSKAKPG